MRKIIVGLVGYSGSGKTLFCQIAKENQGIPSVSTGGFVREELLRRGLESTTENIINVSNALRTENGGIFMRAMIGKIEKLLREHNSIVIDSLREINDYRELTSHEETKRITIVNIISSDRKRYARMLKRNRERGGFSIERFRQLTEFEQALGVGDVANLANHTINNNSTIVQFKRLVDVTLEHILAVKQ